MQSFCKVRIADIAGLGFERIQHLGDFRDRLAFAASSWQVDIADRPVLSSDVQATPNEGGQSDEEQGGFCVLNRVFGKVAIGQLAIDDPVMNKCVEANTHEAAPEQGPAHSGEDYGDKTFGIRLGHGHVPFRRNSSWRARTRQLCCFVFSIGESRGVKLIQLRALL